MSTGARDGGNVVLWTLRRVLSPAPLLTILATAALLAAAIRTLPFGIPLGVILLSWIARYSIAVLESLGSGAREIPVLSLEMIYGTLRGWRPFLVMLVLVSLLFASGAAAFWIGPAAAIALGTLAALALPAALLSLGWTSESSAALNPRAWLHFGRVLGLQVLYLEISGAALVGASAALLSGAIHAQLIVRIALALLGWLLLVALAGATIQAHRDELAAVTKFYRGIDLLPSPAEIERQRQHALDEIYAKWRGGARTDAWDAIARRAAAASTPEDEFRCIYAQVRTWEAASLATRVAQELIHLDLLAERTGYALGMARERLAIDPKFRPRAPGETLRLAQLAADHSDKATAMALLVEFDRQTTDAKLLDASAQLRMQLDAGNLQRGA